MKRIFLLMVCLTLFYGCSLTGDSTNLSENKEISQIREGDLRQGANGGYLLITKSGEIVELEEGQVVLSSFVNKEVEVKGEFSGTTLYVDEVFVK